MSRLLLMLLVLLGSQSLVAGDANPNRWLANAPDDQARFELLENQAGGFSGAMYEVGQRYRSVHEALQRDNHQLALYHWDKIRSAIRSGYQRRPARQANADALFLDTLWRETRSVIAEGDANASLLQLGKARDACMACHVAEKVPFINKQSLFELTLSPR